MGISCAWQVKGFLLLRAGLANPARVSAVILARASLLRPRIRRGSLPYLRASLAAARFHRARKNILCRLSLDCTWSAKTGCAAARADIPDRMTAVATIRVRYAETDAQGIAFNANYLTWCDVAVTEYFRSCGNPYAEFVKTSGFDFHVVHAKIDFKQPARFDELIDLFVSGRVEGARVVWQIEMRREGSLLCQSTLEYAVMDTKSGRPARLPAEWQHTLRLEIA